MSLIGDALREANRERIVPSIRTTKPLGQIVIPSPRPTPHRRSRALGLALVGVATAASVVAGAAISLRTHGTITIPPLFERVPAAPVLTVSPTVVPPAHTPGNAASAVATPQPAPTKGPAVVVPPKTGGAAARPAVDSISKGFVAKQAAAPAPKLETGIVQQGAARTPAPALERAASPSPATTGANSVRLADSLFKLAYAAHVHGVLDAAQDLYDKTIATQSAPSTAYNDFGVLMKQRGDAAAAADLFRQAIAHDNTNVDAWVNLGDILDATGEHADALSAFARASQLDPSRIAIKTRLAAQYQAIGDMTTARQFFEDAVKLDPNEPGGHYALGLFLQSQRDLSGAIREYERFVDLAADRYPANTISDVKQHVASLRKLVP